MVDIEFLIAQLEEGLADQERHLKAETSDLVLERLESTQSHMEQLAKALREGASLTPAQSTRVGALRRQAQMLQEKADSAVADLRQKLQTSARDRQTLASYRSTQQWSDGEAAFLNQKG